MEYDRCTYCGFESDLQREHVIPAHWWGTRSYKQSEQWIVPACRQCNKFAGPYVAFSVPEKAAYVAKQYRRKFRKLLSMPVWKKEEIEELSYTMRVIIEESQITRQMILYRIDYLEKVSEYSADYMRPKWVESYIADEIRKHKHLKKSLRKKRKTYN